MKTLVAIGCVLFASPYAVAEDLGLVGADAGVLADVDAGVVEAAMTSPDSGVPIVLLASAPTLDDPLYAFAGFYEALTTGNGWLAGMFLLFFVVGLLRTVGKRLHALIPDDTKHKVLRPVETVLYFIFDTKIGGWGLNWLTAIGGFLAAAKLAGHAVDASTWKMAVLASTGGTALVELKDDILEWWRSKNQAKAAEVAAKAAVVAPPTQLAVTAEAPTSPAAPAPVPDPTPTPKT